VPCTVAEHVDVPLVTIESGLQTTATEMIVMGTATLTVAVPDLVASWTEIAVIVAFPAAEGVKTPAEVIVPLVAVHVTAGL
jgi:hypothetical protein